MVVLREATWRQAIGTALRIGVLTLGACLWWMAGLLVEAAYGVNVLKYTETVPSTSATSNASEVIRGLGYWYFYGSDHLGPWTRPPSASPRTSGCCTSLRRARPGRGGGRLRALAGALLLLRLVFVGMVLSVGPFPYTNPTPVGGVLKAFMTDTTAGLALRSTDRATPVVLLGLAMLLGSGVTALWRRFSVVGLVTAVVIGRRWWWPTTRRSSTATPSPTTSPNRPRCPPTSWRPSTTSTPPTRAPGCLAIPGNDFASYRWGDTVDTPQPACSTATSSPASSRSWAPSPRPTPSTPWTSPFRRTSANFNALAPMARLLSAGDVMVEYDQNYEHYGIPQPQLLALQLLQTPLGLTDPDVLRHAPAERLGRVDPQRAGPGRPGQRRLAPPARDLHRAQSPADAAGRVQQRARWSSRATPPASTTWPGWGCSTPTAPSTTRARWPRSRRGCRAWRPRAPSWWSPTPTASRPSAGTP